MLVPGTTSPGPAAHWRATGSERGYFLLELPQLFPQSVIFGSPRPGGEVAIVFPPIESDLLGFVDRADDQPDPDREELDLGQGDLDVAGDGQPLVENAIEDVDEAADPMVGRLDVGSHAR
jgi:hypothetical protein